jgi:hypothetical protein
MKVYFMARASNGPCRESQRVYVEFVRDCKDRSYADGAVSIDELEGEGL